MTVYIDILSQYQFKSDLQSRTHLIHPLYLMLPITMAASFAYMMPTAAMPNAIVYSYGYLSIWDMVSS